jgi:hypothetical protein
VVNESTMISGWFSGQPVEKAVTKSADVDRVVIGTCSWKPFVCVRDNADRPRTSAAH